MATGEGDVPVGLQAIHANHLEDLRRTVVWVSRQYPVPPLAQETFLVQSNGIAQWLKLALAQDPQDDREGGLGIAASTRFLLPSRFIWEAYRAVLGANQVPEQSPFDKDRLIWRLYRLLPDLLDEQAFAPLRRFMDGPRPEQRRYQLAGRVADLFDQYQVFRADWLADWEQGADHITLARGEQQPLDDELRWQPRLWRTLVADMDDAGAGTSRAAIHRRFLEAGRGPVTDLDTRSLPERIIVFGVSSLPQQTLEALDILGRFCQVILCVHNPCEFYWADIVSDRDLLRSARKRGAQRPGMPVDPDPEELHLHAQPLLAAWGKQGRDYIRLLDTFDDPESYRARFENAGQRVDLFAPPAGQGLLHQIQDDIRALRPLAESREHWPACDPVRDQSLVFHQAHSPQREVEILHDQLLAAFNADDTLRPRDVIVMVPDINAYTPHVQAVFGRYEPDDPRHIPFTLSDQGQRHRQPVLVALETLLSLPESRFGVSEILSLLEVPPVRACFGIDETDLPRLREWVEQAHIRWGLDASQRASLDLPEGMTRNTWAFGLRRMLLGYAVGAGEDWQGIEPLGDVGGLEARLAGDLDRFIDRLAALRNQLAADAPPQEWAQRLHWIRDTFFGALDGADLLLFNRLQETLAHWLAACSEAHMDEPVALSIVREALLEGLEEGGLNQRFLAGKVNFATLMPMRAIPFRRVCLLGMNDGDYPRVRPPLDFDLMAKDYRPGDRSRREDDRYLFLEALLSAREQLYISWVGRSVRDNAERPPSVLVSQLRDHIDAGWSTESGAVTQALTTVHPLQPFSPAYFPTTSGGLFTYDREWRQAHDAVATTGPDQPLAVFTPEDPLSVGALVAFLRSPVRAFYEQRLQIRFNEGEAALDETEPFGLTGLDNWRLQRELVQEAVIRADDETDLAERLDRVRDRMARRGELGMATTENALRERLVEPMADMFRRYQAALAEWPQALEGHRTLSLTHDGPGVSLTLEDTIDGLRANDQGELARLVVTDGDLLRRQGSGKTYHYANMLDGWVRHLAAHCAGGPLTTRLISRRTDVTLPPLERDQAEIWLRTLLDAWVVGMTEPLPVTLQGAMAWFDGQAQRNGGDEKAWERASDALDNDWAYDPGYLRRAWPDAGALLGDERFVEWRDALYRPLWQLVKGERT
ncbi:exodeoxyribonuclease V subunit gamma [Tamilnaduibacter salinus]|uniref:RecBCD enzyme subunit RecC n=1 Tax=Tamilnaduibacter salinus TaxID=1484056 RepID=A0A2A2I2Y4_9GAMM|nr:exodeoxyribonuclease V subunit gamma [Tamilnaduibacter salinus]PAV25393.1 exodeoxyribonuclease V subunit gamma [Tamilnaduibacter salinus]